MPAGQFGGIALLTQTFLQECEDFMRTFQAYLEMLEFWFMDMMMGMYSTFPAA